MSHVNVALTLRRGLMVERPVVDEGWPINEAAARFRVSWPTVNRWDDRYRPGQFIRDRSSRAVGPYKSDGTAVLRKRNRDLLLMLMYWLTQ